MTTSPIVVLDFETTGLSPDNGDRVVEVGLVRLGNNLCIEREYTTLVNPERAMGASSVHGIRGADVKDAPTFAEIAGDVGEFLEGAIVAAHNASFDVGFLMAEFEHVGLLQRMPPGVSLPVIDTLALSRELVPDAPNHRLPTVCEACGIPPWNHHGALGDARATALLLAHLAQVSGSSFAHSLPRGDVLLEPGWTGLTPSGRARPRKTLATLGKPTNGKPVPTSKPPPLLGEVAVFTGGIGIARQEAARAAEMLGCLVRPGVTKKTSIVVVGDPDVGRLFGQGAGITGKHRRALDLAEAGQRLRVLAESDFMRLAEVVSDEVITDEEWAAVRELVYSVGFSEPDGTPRKQARPSKNKTQAAAAAAELSVAAACPLDALPTAQAVDDAGELPEPQGGRGHPCKTTGCGRLTTTPARQYCDLCRDIRSAPNAFRPEDLIGEKLFFGVAGVTHHPASRAVQRGEQLYLVRDPDNEHDPLAIEVRRQNGDLIGYVPRDAPLQGRFGRREYTQADLARALDAGSHYRLRCYAGGRGLQVEGDCESWLVPHPARLEMWAKRGGDYGRPREPAPFDVRRDVALDAEVERDTERGSGDQLEPVRPVSAKGLRAPLLVVLGALAAVAAYSLLW